MSEQINRYMTVIEARTACNQELQELSQHIAVDYELLEKRYGRLDGQPVDQPTTAVKKPLEKVLFGECCAECPIWQQAGECALREQLQALAYEHRTKYERLNGINEASNEFRGFHKVRREYEGSWGGGTPRNARKSDLNVG